MCRRIANPAERGAYGKQDSNQGVHIGFTYWQNQKFLWVQNSHWLQREENIRYLINILFLTIGVLLGLQQL